MCKKSVLCRSRWELSNAYFLAKFGIDTAENEPCPVCPTPRCHAAASSRVPLSGGFSPPSAAPPLPPPEQPPPDPARAGRRIGRRHDGRSAKFRQNVARFRLYRHRFLQENTRFAAFFKVYQIILLKYLKFSKLLQILRHSDLQNVCRIFTEIADFSNRCFAKILRLQWCKRMQIL